VPFPGRHAPDDQPGVLVVNMAAAFADVPRKCVAGRNLEGNIGAAMSTVFDHRMSAFGMISAV